MKIKKQKIKADCEQFLSSKHFVIFLFSLLLSQTLTSQNKLSFYKDQVDKLIADSIAKELLHDITLKEILITAKHPDKAKFINYEINREKIIKFSDASFFFEFYSPQLNYTFWFAVLLKNNNEIKFDSALFEEIPKCILRNTNCNFITKDTALSIAVRDSILYTDKLDAYLSKEYKKDNFFWLVEEKPNSKKGNIIKKTAIYTRQRRLINAATGVIISR